MNFDYNFVGQDTVCFVKVFGQFYFAKKSSIILHIKKLEPTAAKLICNP